MVAKYSDWFPGTLNPTKIGVYRTNTKNNGTVGWGYATWNGRTWEHYGQWGNHYTSADFIWSGLTEETNNELFEVYP